MPVDVKVTCDLCGEKAERYPSFFDLLEDDTYGPWRAHPDYPRSNIVQKVQLPPRISIRGCLRPGLSVCLCKRHFDSVVAALESWLADLAVGASREPRKD